MYNLLSWEAHRLWSSRSTGAFVEKFPKLLHKRLTRLVKDAANMDSTTGSRWSSSNFLFPDVLLHWIIHLRIKPLFFFAVPLHRNACRSSSSLRCDNRPRHSHSETYRRLRGWPWRVIVVAIVNVIWSAVWARPYQRGTRVEHHLHHPLSWSQKAIALELYRIYNTERHMESLLRSTNACMILFFKKQM